MSVVVPAYNAERWLHRSVQSALADEVEEVVIVDDASLDGTYALAQKLAADDPRVSLVRLAENSGARVARYEGVLRARNRWVAPLDSDDYLEPGAVSDAWEKLVQGDAELCIWTMHQVDDNGEDSVWPDMSELDFPMSGRRAARLTLREWRVHPLGIVSRDRFLRASEAVSVQAHNSDELVTRQLLASVARVCRTEAAYYYVKNPLSTTLKSLPDMRHLARSQAWLLDFACQQGFFSEEPLLAYEMSRDGLWIAEQVAARHPEERLEGLLSSIRRNSPRVWRLGVAHGVKAALRALIGKGEGRRLRLLERTLLS